MDKKRIMLTYPHRLGPVTRSERQLNTPLKNPVILHNIFEYLDLKDIKNCRQVNKTWSFVAEPFLRKLGKITIRDFTDREGLKNPKMMERTFQNCTTKVPFPTLLIFSIGMVDADALFHYLQSKMNETTDLALHNLCLGKIIPPYKQVTIMDSLIGANLNRLEIILNITIKWNIRISTPALQFVGDLTLSGSILDIVAEGPKIAPKNLFLKNMKFLENEDTVTHPLVNTFVDFSKSKQIYLQDNLILDMNSEFNADLLELLDIIILNWEMARGSIQKMIWHLYKFPAKPNSHLNLKCLILRSCHGVDLRGLPRTLEELTISLCTDIIGPEVISLPLLKVLKIKNFSSQEVPIRHFTGCPQLTRLELICYSGRPSPQLRSSWLPRNLDKLSLIGDFTIHTDVKNPVNSLYVKHTSHQRSWLNKLLNGFVPKHVVYATVKGSSGRYVHMILRPQILTFAFGPVDWSHSHFHASPLSRHSNKKGEYYFFKGDKGKCMSKGKFLDLVSSW